MNPHPVSHSEDDLSLDSDERTLVVQSHHLHVGDMGALDADKLFSAENEPTSDTAGSDVLRFDRRSGGLVTGEGARPTPLTPSGSPVRRGRSLRRAWIVASLACLSALALAGLSALYADTIASRVATELRPWLKGQGANQRGR